MNQPDSTIKALNFGIFQTKESYTIYLVGSKFYDQSNDDWATNEDFIAANKYFNLTLSETENSDWMSIEKLVEKLITNFINGKHYESSILKKIERITCGFDDGILVKIK